MAWYYLKDGRRKGPVSPTVILLLLRQGELSPDSPVWQRDAARSIPAGELARKPPADAPTRGNWLTRHWRGELGLAPSFWINGFICQLLALLVARAVGFTLSAFHHPYAFAIGLLLFWLWVTLAFSWLGVGLWRSARGYHRRHAGSARRVWAWLAQASVLLMCLRTGADFLREDFGLLGIWQGFRHTSFEAGVEPFRIEVLNGGRELALRGGFRRGINTALAQALAAHPQAKLVQLDSQGGLIDEGRKVQALIHRHGLSTFVPRGCFSACTVAFLGGNERILREGAQLGFHAPNLLGLKGQLASMMREQERRYLLALGLEKRFVDRILATPADQIWLPTLDELRAAEIVTTVNDGAEYGMLSEEEPGALEAELQRAPIYRALKEHAPDDYAAILSRWQGAQERGESLATVREEMTPRLWAFGMAQFDRIPPKTARRYLALQIDHLQTLRRNDPKLCFDFIFRAGQHDYGQYLSPRQNQNQAELLAALIAAADQPELPPQAEQVATIRQALMERLYAEVGTALEDLPRAARGEDVDRDKSCAMVLRYYDMAQGLPDAELTALVKTLFGPEKKE